MPRTQTYSQVAEQPRCFAREELVRSRLLAELSTLREKHEKLLSKLRKCNFSSPCCSPQRDDGNGVSSVWSCSCSLRQGVAPLLGQDDRDAIEALFNDSQDDFTREFNEGRGRVERGDLVQKVASLPFPR
ncbi:hypothetical protein ERJ75_001608800 [Trypanosoma vivax]|uniref:Uncharacterized protein n=1 Tax=Trypanosoma vivax (strain Y486) TaxID=1055687 RepID=G0TSV7_TRYVY|nr:hypothetical protein TRVL_08534 [Trypanosoma vivax]KAH8605816.1 hypothetical protein ERJ75_001608800 [Trypanosoma vivax]CCC47036.1 conserved hypothetical protein [Trypanosoma vivax Y486]